MTLLAGQNPHPTVVNQIQLIRTFNWLSIFMADSEITKYLEKFLTELSGVKRGSDHTIKAYRVDLLHFNSYLENHSISRINKISEKVIRRYVVSLNENEFEKS